MLQIDEQRQMAAEMRTKVDEDVRESHARLRNLDKERKVLAAKEADLAKELSAIGPEKTDVLRKKTKAELDVKELEAEVSRSGVACSQAQDDLRSVKREIHQQEKALDQVWYFAPKA